MKIVVNMMIVLLISAIVISHSVRADHNIQEYGWSEIAVGNIHSLAIKSDGTLWTWGSIRKVEAGYLIPVREQLIPVQVEGMSNVIKVAAGQSHSLALRNDGSVWAWGSNFDGQLSEGAEMDQPTPWEIKGVTNVVDIAADWTRSFAVTKDGSVWGWGGIYYKDGNGDINNYNVPTKLNGLEDIIEISVGYGNFLALKEDGTVWTFTAQIEGLKNIVQIAAGGQFSYGLKADGTVMRWGSNGSGRVDGSEVSDQTKPSVIEVANHMTMIQASAGGPLLLKNDGTVWTSGKNSGGQLGIGSVEETDRLVQVNNLSKIVNIAANGIGYKSMAIRSDGTLWSWGYGISGDGSEGSKLEPVWVKSFDTEILQKDPITVKVNGKIIYFEQPPVIINKRSMVPLRKIFEALDAVVAWEDTTKTVSATKGDTKIILSINNKIAYKDDQEIEMEVAPIILKENTMVPVRFISEALGAEVTWNEQFRIIDIILSEYTHITMQAGTL